MDQTKMITSLINKYQDTPEIQTDLKKMLQYAESEFRYFIRQFTKEQPRPVHSQRTRTINKIIAEIGAVGPQAVLKAIIADAIKGYAPDAAAAILKAINAAAAAADASTLQADEAIPAAVERHAGKALALHPEIDAKRLKQDMTIAISAAAAAVIKGTANA